MTNVVWISSIKRISSIETSSVQVVDIQVSYKVSEFYELSFAGNWLVHETNIDVVVGAVVFCEDLLEGSSIEAELVADLDEWRISVPSPVGNSIAYHYSLQVKEEGSCSCSIVIGVHSQSKEGHIYPSIRLTGNIEVVLSIFRVQSEEIQHCS